MDYIFSYLPLTEDKLHVARIFAYIHFFFFKTVVSPVTEEFLVQRDAREKLAKWMNKSWKLLFHTWHVLGFEWCSYLRQEKLRKREHICIGQLTVSVPRRCAQVAAQFLSGWNGHDWVSVPCTLWCVWSWCLLALLLQHLCLCLNAFSAQRSMGSFISRHGLKVPGS